MLPAESSSDSSLSCSYLALLIRRFYSRDPFHPADRADASRKNKLVRIGGAVGKTDQAVREATKLRDLGYHAALLSLAAMKDSSDEELVAHCRAVGDVIPLVGFYLQPAVGGRVLPFAFWRKFAEIPSVCAMLAKPWER